MPDTRCLPTDLISRAEPVRGGTTMAEANRNNRFLTRLARGVMTLVVTLTTFSLVEASTMQSAEAIVPPLLGQGSADQVSADPLPTVQINGVVWDQEVVGNTVYVVGEFTHARPAGSPPGVNETPRGNVLAYDITTGALIPGFVTNTNGPVRTVTTSPDGSRVYIGGTFTQVNGINRYRIAALDPTSGAVISRFNAITNATVKDLVATNDTVYAGGIFTGAGGGVATPRAKLAAFSASNGALTGWAPTASGNVETLLLTPDGSRLIAGGIFAQLNGQDAMGMGALDPVDGSSLPWAANQVIRNGGSFDGAILHLFTDGTSVYGNGFTWGRLYGNLEGVFKADATTGELTWVQDCHGDTYQAAAMNGYVYTASHAHFCGNVGGAPQSSTVYTDWGEYQRHNVSFKDEVAGTLRRDNWSYHNLEGLPAPSMTTWFPEWTPGTFTGQGQAAWAVEGNGEFLTFGGEFTRVNTLNQQGLVRFAVRSNAPNATGPRLTGDRFAVSVVSQTAGQVRVTLPANFDRDDHVLTYDLFRNGALVQTTSAKSTYYDQPAVSFIDNAVTPGQTYTYRVRASDPWGNAQLSNQYPVTVATSGPPTPYADRVLSDGAALYWRLGDAPGQLQATDAVGGTAASVNNMTFGRPGAIIGDPDTAASPTGTSSRVVQPPLINRQGLPEPQAVRDDLTVEVWFRTTSTAGGRLIGMGNSSSGTSSTSNNDRLLYVTNDGRAIFGVRTRAEGTGYTSSRVNRTIQSQTGLNDGNWHHVVGVLASDGMRLYVDGELVSTRGDVNSGHGYYGYWRVGADTLSGWTSTPSSTRLNGDIDEAAVYYRSLSGVEITNHWNLSGHGTGNIAPTASFTSTTNGLTATFDASGSSDIDGTITAYQWNFGDGNTGTGGAPVHTYAASGTYPVSLTVTDNQGASHSLQQPVVVLAQNAAPTAAFSFEVSDFAVSVDGAASSDSDGSIVSYQWGFGDGATASGATADHTYAAAGAYPVTLTVTDDGGATGQVTRQVVVSEPGAPVVHAADAFERTSTGSFGQADIGGAWFNTGTVAANYFTSDGTGQHRMASAGAELRSYLSSVSAQDVLATVDVAWDKAPDAGGQYASLVVRRNGTSDYRARVRAMGTRTTLTVMRRVNGGYTSLGMVSLPDVVFQPGDTLRLQLRAVGSGSTTLEAKVWELGSTEPTDWQVTATDTTPSLQGGGEVGLESYLSGASGGLVPLIARWDNLLVRSPSGAVAENLPPTAAFTAQVSDLSVMVDAAGSSDPDGLVVAYAWDFGDGATASGATADHTYAAAGTYPVKLTVTDDDGATGQVIQQVVVTEPGAPGVFAADTFERTTTGSFGTADLGGQWTNTGSIATNYFTADGAGQHRMASTGAELRSYLGSVSAQDVLATVDVAWDKAPGAGGQYASLVVRRIGSSDYRMRVRAMESSTTLTLLRVVDNSFTSLGVVTVPGVYDVGDVLRMRLRVSGSGTATLDAKVWKVGAPEPGWQITRTDTTASLQAPGAVGLESYLSGLAQGIPPLVARWDDLSVVEP
jgi:PKD repeat protein